MKGSEDTHSLEGCWRGGGPAPFWGRARAGFAKSKQDSLPWGQELGDTPPDPADLPHMSWACQKSPRIPFII